MLLVDVWMCYLIRVLVCNDRTFALKRCVKRGCEEMCN